MCTVRSSKFCLSIKQGPVIIDSHPYDICHVKWGGKGHIKWALKDGRWHRHVKGVLNDGKEHMYVKQALNDGKGNMHVKRALKDGKVCMYVKRAVKDGKGICMSNQRW